ncbi:MAG: SelT/SelW/SelH family protein [Halolamina sp.]
MTEIQIEYCVPCGLREQAIETAEAVLDEFGRDVEGVELVTGHGGVFEVSADGELVFDTDEREYDPQAIVESVAARVA